MIFLLSAALTVSDIGTFQSSMWIRDAGIPSVIRDFVNFLMVLFGLEFDISSLGFEFSDCFTLTFVNTYF